MYNCDILTPPVSEKNKNKKGKFATVGVNTDSFKKSLKPYPACKNTWKKQKNLSKT